MLETSKPMRVVLIFDPAIVKLIPTAKMYEYGRSRDIGVIEPLFCNTDLPTVYSIRKLPRSIINRYVDIFDTEDLRAIAAFQYGIVRVTKLRTDDNVRIDFEPTGKVATSDGEIICLDERELDRFSRIEQLEIGRVVYRHSFLPTWIAGYYVPPPMSVELWANQVPQSADASPTTQE